jgi:hypothetical protein
MSFVSCGEALATSTAKGRPWPSLIAMILLPLPRRVGPMAEPLFAELKLASMNASSQIELAAIA